MTAQELKLQYQLSNGTWKDAPDSQIEGMLTDAEAMIGKSADEKIVYKHNPLYVRDFLREETLDLLDNGRELDIGTDWYDVIRSGAVHEARVAANAAAAAKIPMVKCNCGHTVPRGSVMSASLGTSCPDCYDRMSA